MPLPRSPLPTSPRATWWATFLLLAVAGASWALATPLMSGADESDHAIRAAAVVRGQPVGGEAVPLGEADNVFITVEVPEAYAAAREVSGCFIDFRGSPVPNPTDFLPEVPPCRPMEGGRATTDVLTLQYRGQPTYYAVVGLPTLVDPAAGGARAMRVLSAALTAALLASALASARGAGAGRLVPLAVLVGTTPVCLWLSGQVNTGGFEIAAALLVWTAGARVARAPAVGGRDVARLGAGMVALVVVRGLSPLFAVAALAALALVARPGRLRELGRRRDVRLWGGGIAVAGALSIAWLAWIQVAYPLDPRPGAGAAEAAGRWSWYLRQAIGVFGVNDVALPWLPVLVWLGVLAVVLGLGLAAATWRERAVVALLAVGGFVVNITADGLSLPPIGYFWQGRYVLPLLVGAPVLAAACATWRAGSDPATVDAPERRPAPSAPVAAGLAAALVAVHVWAFAEVARHMASQGDALGFLDALRDPTWSTPVLPAWAWTTVYGVAVGGIAALALRPPSDDEA